MVSRLQPLAAALLAVAAVVVLGVGIVRGPEASLLGLGVVGGAESSVGEQTLVTPASVIEANNSPGVVRNPIDEDNLVIVNRVDRPGFSVTVSTSTDGGTSWTSTTPPLPEGRDRPYAPDAVFGPGGRLYLVYANLMGRGNVPEDLWIATSDDGGQTFSEPSRVEVAGELSFQAQLAIDRESGTLYLTWLAAENVGLLKFNRPLPSIVAARSTDGGETWSEPTVLSDDDRPRVGAAVPVVVDGDLTVVYKDFKGDTRDFQALEGPPWDQPFALVATRSTDGADSFAEGVEFESELKPARRFLPFLPPFPGLAVHPDGSLVVTWADARNGDLDVFVRRSADGIAGWSDPVRVNDNDLQDGTDQYLPTVDVAPGGRVDVAFLDRRLDVTNVLMDAALASSWDGGATFRNLRLSATSFDSRIGPSAASYLETDFGTRIGLTSGGAGAYAAWTDTQLGNETTGRQDVVGARATLPAPGPGLVGRAVAAVGLLAAGVGLFLVWSRRLTAALPDDEAAVRETTEVES